jgi:hypothetical protein
MRVHGTLGDDPGEASPAVALGRLPTPSGPSSTQPSPGGGPPSRGSYRAPPGSSYGGAAGGEQPGTPGGAGGGAADSGGVDDAQRRLPLPVRNLVDRLSAFDRDVMLPIFGSADSASGQQPGVGGGQAAGAAAGGQPGQQGQQRGDQNFTLV